MKIIDTSTDRPTPRESLWVYNGLDCCITFEVLEALLPQLTQETQTNYDLSRALQAPILEMNMRGVLIDQHRRTEIITAFQKDMARVEEHFNLILSQGLGINLSWRSNPQMMYLLYEVMRIKPVLKRNSNGGYSPTVDRGALEKLRSYFYAQPIIDHILTLRDLSKKVEVLRTRIDSDGRIRTSYNIAGTNTGRLSSASSDFDSGRNLQNIEERLRSVFVADQGYKFANIDLQQADSRCIGALIFKHLNDSKYLDVCESEDLHTTAAALTWPEVPSKEIKTRKFYREDSYRQCAKRLGHATNNYGKPAGISILTHYPRKTVEDFQSRYFRAFPGIANYHEWTKQMLLSTGILHNIWGRRRRFFGRRNDEATVRDAAAYGGQSSTADFINHAMLKVWRQNLCTILIQVHDSILVQYPEDREDEILPQVIAEMKCPLTIKGREFYIPCEAKVGWNWGKYDEATNPNGLQEYLGNDPRKRIETTKLSLLDRVLL